MVKVITDTGFECSIHPDALDDYDLLMDIMKIDAGHMEVLPNVLVSFLGEEQHEALMEHCKSEAGKVSFRKMTAEFHDIMLKYSEQNKATKN